MSAWPRNKSIALKGGFRLLVMAVDLLSYNLEICMRRTGMACRKIMCRRTNGSK
jgi:hypothetical protein